MQRLSRIIHLLTLLQSGVRVTPGDLATRLNVSKRTVYRDLEVLRDAGVDITYQRGHGYRLSNTGTNEVGALALN